MSVHHSVTLGRPSVSASFHHPGEHVCSWRDDLWWLLVPWCWQYLFLVSWPNNFRMLHNSLRHSTIYGYFQSGVTTFNVRFFSALLLICFSIGLVGRLVYFSSSSSSSSSSWVYCYLNCIPFLGFVCYKSKPNLVIDVIFVVVVAVSAIFGIEVTDFSTDQ